MPKIYPQDLRDRAVAYWQKTGHKSQTAQIFNITRKTLDNWIKLYEEQGHTQPKPFKPVGVKYIITDLVAFEQYVRSSGFDTAKQLHRQYLKDHPNVNISYDTLLRTLHRINWSFKKRPRSTDKQMSLNK